MAPARLLDLTRSLRRAGRTATGVDRVERAYLDHFIADDAPAYGLIRTSLGFALLDRSGMQQFRDGLLNRRDWPQADWLSRVAKGRDKALTQAETLVRRESIGRCLPIRLSKMLRAQMGSEFTYYNVGHSNLTRRTLHGVKAAQGRVEVLIHDVIPVEYPDYQRPGTVAPFIEKLKRVRDHADRIIYNSSDTRQRADTVMKAFGEIPPSIVAHLGTIPPVGDPAALPPGVLPHRPFFITVGTIEPRKNHLFLLDLWEELGAGAPPLLICGSRGWNNDAVFARLDALPADGPVREVAGLTDAALNALVQQSAGMLFPSHAEGFGLPPVEALMLGTRVLCNDLAVLREILGNYATFASVFDRQTWLHTIRSWENTQPNAGEIDGFAGPDWTDHFKTVLRLS